MALQKKFLPVLFNDSDKFSVKVSAGCSDFYEGQICRVVGVDTSNFAYLTASLYNGAAAFATVSIGTIVSAPIYYNQIRFFPVYIENVDDETVSGTISAGDYIVGFDGKRARFHKSITESGFATSWASVGKAVAVGSTGKITPYGGKNDTPYIIGYCVGTPGGTWVDVIFK